MKSQRAHRHVLGLDLSFPISLKSGSTTMIGDRDESRFVSVRFYAVTGGSVSRYRLFLFWQAIYQAIAQKSTERLLALVNKEIAI
jgi:hypothetical protein